MSLKLHIFLKQKSMDLNHPSIKNELIKIQNQNIRDLRAWRNFNFFNI